MNGFTSWNDSLCHYGIRGQRWGFRRFQNPDGTLTPEGVRRYQKEMQKQAEKDAFEYARAKMFYGEGAGTRRKLINASVKQRSRDEFYKKAFEDALSRQDMSYHALKARKERTSKDNRERFKTGAKNTVNAILGRTMYMTTGALALYTIGHYTGLNSQIGSFVKNNWRVPIRMVKGALHGAKTFAYSVR